jgi:hypothetical protein
MIPLFFIQKSPVVNRTTTRQSAKGIQIRRFLIFEVRVRITLLSISLMISNDPYTIFVPSPAVIKVLERAGTERLLFRGCAAQSKAANLFEKD